MPEWNEQKSAAVTRLALRVAVAGYLVYLAWRIIGGTLNGTSTITPMLSYVIFAVFCLAAIGFGFYSFREFRRAINAPAETPESEGENESSDHESESDVDLND